MVAAEEEWEGKVAVKSAGVGVQETAEAHRASGVGVRSPAGVDHAAGRGGSPRAGSHPPEEMEEEGADAGGARRGSVASKAGGEGVTIAKVLHAGRVREVRLGAQPVDERAQRSDGVSLLSAKVSVLREGGELDRC